MESRTGQGCQTDRADRRSHCRRHVSSVNEGEDGCAGGAQGGADYTSRRSPGSLSPDILPSAAAIYARKVTRLAAALNRPEERQLAADALRMLIEKIVLTPGPERGELYATLHGELRTFLEWTEWQAIGKAGKTTKPAAGATGLSVSVVAGAGYDHNLRPEQVKMVAGGRNHHNLRYNGSHHSKATVAQETRETTIGSPNFLNLLFQAAA